MIYLTNINLNQNELQNAVLQPLAVAPSNPKLGQIYTDSTNNKIKWYNGTEWRTVGVVVESSTTNGKIKVDGVEMTVYTLPIASQDSLGGIKVGSGLTINPETGVMSATGGGTADSVDWANITSKPTLAYTGVFAHTATTIAGLKEQVQEAVTAGTLKEYSIYSGSLSGFSTSNFPEAQVDITVFTATKTTSPIILFWSNAGKSWFCYASKTDDTYDNSVYQLTNEALTASDLTALNAVIDANYIHTDNNFTNTLLEKLNNIAANAQVNIIEKIKVNGAEVTPDSNKTVDISVPVISTNVETDSDSDTKTASPKAVKTYVDAKVSSTYRPAGSIAASAIPAPSASLLGNVYNLSEEFITTDAFVEGAGKSYSAGTNIVVIQSGSEYKLDVLAGFIDLSSYVKEADLATLAKTGKWSDINEKPTFNGISSVSSTLSAQSGTFTVPKGNITNVVLYDSVTKEMVIADITYTDEKNVTVSCSETPTNPLTVILYYSESII